MIGAVQSFHGSLYIVSRDTQSLERRKSMARSRLKRNANYIYHTGTNIYGCRDDAYFDCLARHIDDIHYKSTA
jgi:hypothetical protein